MPDLPVIAWVLIGSTLEVLFGVVVGNWITRSNGEFQSRALRDAVWMSRQLETSMKTTKFVPSGAAGPEGGAGGPQE